MTSQSGTGTGAAQSRLSLSKRRRHRLALHEIREHPAPDRNKYPVATEPKRVTEILACKPRGFIPEAMYYSRRRSKHRVDQAVTQLRIESFIRPRRHYRIHSKFQSRFLRCSCDSDRASLILRLLNKLLVRDQVIYHQKDSRGRCGWHLYKLDTLFTTIEQRTQQIISFLQWNAGDEQFSAKTLVSEMRKQAEAEQKQDLVDSELLWM